MDVKQVQTKKIAEIIREQLEQMIRDGSLKPGEKIDSVEQLSKDFSVSRSAVREALSALRAIGLITIKQGEGTFVNKFDFSNMIEPVVLQGVISQKEMIELFEVRKMIEVGAASLAATNRTDSHIKNLRKALADMEQNVGNEQLAQKADVEFHLEIAEATGNNILINLMQQLSDTLNKTMNASRKISLFSKVQTLKGLQVEHERIFQAILEKDEDQAKKAMLSHLLNVEIEKFYYND